MSKKLKAITLLTAVLLGAGGLNTSIGAHAQSNIFTSRFSNKAPHKIIHNTPTFTGTSYSSNGGAFSQSYLKPKTRSISKKLSVRQQNLKTARSLPLLNVTKTTVPLHLINNKLTNSSRNISANTLIKPNDVLKSHGQTYIDGFRFGRNLGWINIKVLSRTNTYKIPYKYTSQFWPSKAKDACEIASLKTAMSSAGKGNNVPLANMVRLIPLSPNANLGYTGNPFHYGTHASIYPPAMVNIAKQYGANAKVITGSSSKQFINYVTHGDPVVYESPFMMKRPDSDHDLTITGYKPGYFYVVDPFAAYRSSRRGTWVSIQRFNQLYGDIHRHQHALAILPK